MLNMNYDILILSSEKYFNNLQYLFNSLKYLNPTYNKIYCVCPKLPPTLIEGIEYKLDKEVLDIDIFKIKIQPNWIYQQYIKLFQQITLNDYLVIDADIVLNKQIDIISNDKPNFLISNKTKFNTFFEYSKRILNIDRIYDSSFISEIMLFKRNIIEEMIYSRYTSTEEFINVSNSLISINRRISEYELYGNYVYLRHHDEYDYKNIKISELFMFNKYSDIDSFINDFSSKPFDILNISKHGII